MRFDRSDSMTNDKYLLYFMVSPWFHLPKLILAWSKIRVVLAWVDLFPCFQPCLHRGSDLGGEIVKIPGKTWRIFSYGNSTKVNKIMHGQGATQFLCEYPANVFFLNIVYVLPDFLQSLKSMVPLQIFTIDCCSSGTRHWQSLWCYKIATRFTVWRLNTYTLIGAPSTVPLSIITLPFFGGKHKYKKHHVGRSVAMTVNFGAIPAYPYTHPLGSTFSLYVHWLRRLMHTSG